MHGRKHQLYTRSHAEDHTDMLIRFSESDISYGETMSHLPKDDYDLLKLRRHLREHQHEELVEYIIKNMGDRTVRPSGNDSADISATFT
jgi:hypothetical protein